MLTNRYNGNCTHCFTNVPAGTGFYNWGAVTCTETITAKIDHNTYQDFCLPAYNHKFNTSFTTPEEAQQAARTQEAAELAAAQERVRQHCVNGEIQQLAVEANVRSLAQVINKITGADIEISQLTFDQATAVRNELQKRIDRKTNAKILDTFKASNTCNRCGGAGRADKWVMTGSVCYQCGGTGKFYNLK